jgi:hypothetical protein
MKFIKIWGGILVISYLSAQNGLIWHTVRNSFGNPTSTNPASIVSYKTPTLNLSLLLEDNNIYSGQIGYNNFEGDLRVTFVKKPLSISYGFQVRGDRNGIETAFLDSLGNIVVDTQDFLSKTHLLALSFAKEIYSGISLGVRGKYSKPLTFI